MCGFPQVAHATEEAGICELRVSRALPAGRRSLAVCMAVAVRTQRFTGCGSPVLECLGAALVSEWNDLPTDVFRARGVGKIT